MGERGGGAHKKKISTRCSDETQISWGFLYHGWGILVSFGWGKVLSYELESVPIFQTNTVLFEISKRFIVNNNSVVIWLQQHKK